MNKKNSQIGYWIGLISVICSLGIHIYLANHHYDFKFGQAASEGLCNINEKFNCNTTTNSKYSEFLGLPISVFALSLHGILLLLFLALKTPLFSQDTKDSFINTLRVLTSFIFLTSVIMAFISLFILNTLCPMCSAAYGFSLTLLLGTAIGFGLKPVLNFSLIKSLGIIGGIILLFSFSYNSNQLQKYGGKDAQEMIQLQFDDWMRSPQKNIAPLSPLQLNPNENSKIKIVEFADFLCGHCAKAFPIVHQFAKNNPEVELSFQAFPLDGECNAVVQYVSGAACYLARVAYCAGLQDQGWATQEWIFKNQARLVAKDSAIKELEAAAGELKLNWEEIKTCSEASETLEIIKKQAQLGVDLDVKGTPALFINGKRVPSPVNLPALNKIKNELLK